MPCSSCKARVLLDNKKACVIKHTPFTIKLCTVAQELTKSCGCWKPLKIT
ncbi:hypothetical protein DWX95_14270 [Butyricicoccus sp. AF22-28AC]|nr:hypothetical protein DWX95_14270 [Butyricicoccus sp. AF22-28AC]